METSGFNDNNISEQSKEALQSKTWQEVRKAMKTEIRHFADELLKDDPYGYPWEQVVDAYLKSGYKEEDAQYGFTVLGSTYKVLKREEVTAFYDADGNTLFDVANERLEKEYEWLMNDKAKADTEITNMEEDEKDVAEKENPDTVKEETDSEIGEAQEEKQSEDEKEAAPDDGADNDVISSDEDKELLAPTTAEVVDSQKENGRPTKLVAKEKLEKELKGAKDKNFAEPIIGYLLKRCEEDEGVAEDVAQEHKTWDKCLDYIYEQARKQATGNRAAVRDDVVYEWAEDYYHKDDKAEEAEKAKKEAEAKAKREKAAAKSKPAKTATKPSTDRNKAKVPAKEEKLKEQPKPKKSAKDMEGQLDMFSMMGM